MLEIKKSLHGEFDTGHEVYYVGNGEKCIAHGMSLEDAELFVRAKTCPDEKLSAALARIRELESTMIFTSDGVSLLHPEGPPIPMICSSCGGKDGEHTNECKSIWRDCPFSYLVDDQLPKPDVTHLIQLVEKTLKRKCDDQRRFCGSAWQLEEVNPDVILGE